MSKLPYPAIALRPDHHGAPDPSPVGGAPPVQAWQAWTAAARQDAAAQSESAWSQAELAQAFRATLSAGLPGLCFSPYLQGQQPGSAISEAQIRERLQVIRPHTAWVRTFSCTDGHEQTPRLAHEMGLKTLVGAWLGTDRETNERELQGVIEVARGGHADLVAVGNEVLLREDMGVDELLACLEHVKRSAPGVAVGYVDAYYLFELHPSVTAACDVVMTNCYPFWEGCPREGALAYMQSMLERTRLAAPGKRVLISETGWPDRGGAFHGAAPSREGAMRYFVDTVAWARREGIELFWFSAFDEAWKIDAEGDVGACWGLWDKDGACKFP